MANLTSTYVAKEIGVTKQALSIWCNLDINDNQSIKSDDLRKIASILNCSMEELYTQPLREAV